MQLGISMLQATGEYEIQKLINSEQQHCNITMSSLHNLHTVKKIDSICLPQFPTSSASLNTLEFHCLLCIPTAIRFSRTLVRECFANVKEYEIESFNTAIGTPVISCWIWCCSYAITQYKINWISVRSVVKFICLLQVGAICLQYSHGDVIGQPNMHCRNLSYNIEYTQQRIQSQQAQSLADSIPLLRVSRKVKFVQLEVLIP